MNGSPLAPAGYQTGLAEDLEVVAGVGQCEPHLPGEDLDGPLAVGQHVQNLDSPAAGDALADARELIEELALHPVIGHRIPIIT
jgi:hypothetical protein